jgi:predicted DsbA family dithiol-disulfide isomerase
MVDVKDSVDFYWDPICPWCWITSRWMVDVGRQKQIHVSWKLFSLKIINKERDIPEHFKILHQIGLRALRLAAAVSKEYGNDGLAKLYTVMGTCYHHDNEDIDEPDILEGILKSCGFPTHLAAAVDEETWDKIIEADMDQAVAKVGKDVGVPLIVLDGGQGPGFFGPVFSPAPTGKPAVALWDALIVAGRTPGFFELKRTRETDPIFGDRPEL